jgi:tetratricopeptide (TPR) repeat protein
LPILKKYLNKTMSILLNQLIEFYEEDPSDPFNIYALATEYLKTDAGKSKSLFEELLLNHPNYTPTYYHAAALYSSLNDNELAKKTYLKGISITEKLNKTHALMELKRAYQMLLDEEFE